MANSIKNFATFINWQGERSPVTSSVPSTEESQTSTTKPNPVMKAETFTIDNNLSINHIIGRIEQFVIGLLCILRSLVFHAGDLIASQSQ